MKRTMLPALALLLTFAASLTHAASPAPCSDPEYRLFDFWLGDWRVSGPAGAFVGMNRISLEYGGCVVHEHYVTGKGYSGESLNTWDAARKVWHQTWVDSGGLLLTLEGQWNGSQMIMEGLAPGANGEMAKQKITWTPNADGSVRQLWEVEAEDGTWSVTFDGLYTKQ